MSLFAAPIMSAEQKVSDQIDNNLRNAARAILNSYTQIRLLIYKNPLFTDSNGNCNSDAIYAAFAKHTTSNLNPDQLGEAARLCKTIINLFAPGTIVDDVPEVLLIFNPPVNQPVVNEPTT